MIETWFLWNKSRKMLLLEKCQIWFPNLSPSIAQWKTVIALSLCWEDSWVGFPPTRIAHVRHIYCTCSTCWIWTLAQIPGGCVMFLRFSTCFPRGYLNCNVGLTLDLAERSLPKAEVASFNQPIFKVHWVGQVQCQSKTAYFCYHLDIFRT